MSAWRGWRDGVGLVLAVFGLLALAAGADCLGLFGLGGRPAWTTGWNLYALSTVPTGLWLTVVLWQPAKGLGLCLVKVIPALALPLAGVGLAQAPNGLPDALAVAVHGVAGCWLSLALARRRGLTLHHLGVTPPHAGRGRGGGGRWRALAVAGVVFAGMCATSQAMGLTHFLLAWLPVGAPRQTTLHDPLQLAARFLTAGVLEEVVVVAGLVTALDAARARPWQIYLAGTAARVSYHLYYGPIAVLAAAFGAVNIWVFRRCRRLTPLITAHIAYDAIAIYTGTIGTTALSLTGAVTLAWTVNNAIQKTYQRALRNRKQPRNPLRK